MNSNNDDVSWFVLHCQKGYEDKVLDALKRKLDLERFTPFIPTWIKPFTGRGAEKYGVIGITAPCFPNYVFVQTQNMEAKDKKVLKSLIRVATDISGALLFLYNEDKENIEMRPNERRILQRLMNKDFCIESSVGYMEDDRVKIVSGPLVGFEDYILKANWQKRWMLVDMSFVSYVESDWLLRLGLEYVGNANRHKMEQAKMIKDSGVEDR